jgi:predicted protein tyrosine phosphatase
MKQQPASVPFRPVVCGIHDLDRFRSIDFSHIVSIVDPGLPLPDILGSFSAHERLELRFHDIIDPDEGMVAPQRDHIDRLLSFGASMAHSPPCKVLLHCHAGVSRSTAAAVLLLAQAQGPSSKQTAADMFAAFPNAWPNLRMIELGDKSMGREGELIAAARAHYATLLQRYPALRSIITERHLRSSPSGG